MSEKTSIHCFVSGRVHGVWFRASTQDEAKKLGITGWAKNLPDGRVEVFASGDKKQLEKLHAWLHKGPQLAKVTEVIYEEVDFQEFDGFSTR